jgi:predicted ATP-dependent serine protease
VRFRHSRFSWDVESFCIKLLEGGKLGFEKAIVPRANQPKAKISGLEVMAVERVDQAVHLLLICNLDRARIP